MSINVYYLLLEENLNANDENRLSAMKTKSKLFPSLTS